MIGFEVDKWERARLRADWFIFTHKDFPFIKIDCSRKYKDRNKIAWKITATNWNLKLKNNVYIYVFYTKFTADKIEEIFNNLMKIDDVKYIILNYLFVGKW